MTAHLPPAPSTPGFTAAPEGRARRALRALPARPAPAAVLRTGSRAAGRRPVERSLARAAGHPLARDNAAVLDRWCWGPAVPGAAPPPSAEAGLCPGVSGRAADACPRGWSSRSLQPTLPRGQPSGAGLAKGSRDGNSCPPPTTQSLGSFSGHSDPLRPRGKRAVHCFKVCFPQHVPSSKQMICCF